VPGSGHGDLEDGFEVRLVEAREDPRGLVGGALGVDVDLAVGRVDEAVHALTGAGIAHVGLDAQLVVGREPGQGETIVLQRARVQHSAVEHRPMQRRGPHLDEGRHAGFGTTEPDDGSGAEHLLAAHEVEVHGVGADVQQAGSCLRLRAGECGHDAMVSHRDGAG
jgi:hypothetical protein